MTFARSLKSLAVLVLALFSVACAPEAPVLTRTDTLHVSAADAAAYPEAVEALGHAVEMWREDLGGVVDLKIVIGGSGHKVRFFAGNTVECQNITGVFAGCTDDSGEHLVIDVATEAPMNTLAAYLAHELGHGLGLEFPGQPDHDHAAEGLMCAKSNGQLYIDRVTAAAAYAAFGLSVAVDEMPAGKPCPKD